MSRCYAFGRRIASGCHPFFASAPTSRDNRPLFSADSLHAVPNNSHRRQIDARTSNASVVREPINSRRSRGRDGREFRKVIAYLHARRNLERDMSRFERGKWQSNDAHMAQSGMH